jgi:hypothetical protein
MKITILRKFKLFSHKPGICCLIPGSPFEAEIFPALIRFYDLRGNERLLLKEQEFTINGPLKSFTVLQDLERGCLSVWGDGLCYHVLPDLSIVHGKKIPLGPQAFPERFSCGIHKKQEWEKIVERRQFEEIFPYWFLLGNQLPPLKPLHCRTGIFALLDACKEEIEKKTPETIFSCFERLFLAGFRGMLVPRLKDEEYQGIIKTTVLPEESPLHLLKEGAGLIRSLYLQVNDEKISLLPFLPPQCHAGRFLRIQIPDGELDIEWSKKKIRRCILRSQQERTWQLQIPSVHQGFRLRTSMKDKGKWMSRGEGLEIKSGGIYLLDRFQK